MPNPPTQLTSVLSDEEGKLLACVHCGLCLEACPTYVHTGDENDGPRGRIYLMRAVEEGRLSLESNSFTRHIERCLGCRACESVCPSGVEYGQLLEAARADIADAGRARGFTSRALRFALRHVWLHPARLRLAFRLARLLRDSRLPRLLLRTGLTKLLPARAEFTLALLDSSTPAPLSDEAVGISRDAKSGASPVGDGLASSASAADAVAPVEIEESNEATEFAAMLFEGCVTEGLFARVNRASVRVLEAQGCRTCVPRGQVCCGALHAHAGDLEGARRLARRNIEAFEEAGDAPVVTNAGGCGAMLASYAHLLARDAAFAARARAFSSRVRDVSQQLAATGIRAGASLGDLKTTYDASCHLLNGQKAQVEPLSVLSAVPGLRLAPLEGSDVCCGGAGVYNLVEPELSSRVLDEKLRHVRETGARILATGNPGCHMQIGAGARLAHLRLAVCHPVELLDESYRRAGFYDAAKNADEA
ncbi:MAG TPA: heterodisulfide reductase-related iron-sulfur binding cluster [Pyrinomonadaceae bacterium]|jgi:glycolate oxidase iron-sulfur subunit|nr:heterodisulfide reductase-related iron-sulfur binding cluster [Pyrinomonadaceae bacterium]